MDGWELLCRLEERDDLRGVPVLVMSAAAHMAAPRVGVRYIPKPLCIETLLAQVAGMIVGDAAVAGQRSPVPALQAGEAGGTEDSAAA
jgi:CheY-like chemotaxis protein